MSLRTRLSITAVVSLAIWSLLIWQQLHDGVPAHSFMARDDMPSISNWWGALTLPMLTCLHSAACSHVSRLHA